MKRRHKSKPAKSTKSTKSAKRKYQKRTFVAGLSLVSVPDHTKVLRSYQANDVQFIVQTGNNICIEGPTGSGKTLTATAAAAILLREGGATGIIVSTPMEHIENGFTDRDYTTISLPVGEAYVGCLYSVPATFIQAARENGKSGSAIADYLGTSRDYVLACTHAALLYVDLPKDLTGKVLIVDEAHRAPVEGNKFSKVVGEWESRGGRLIFFTATPFRGDGERVIRDGMRVLRRSLAQHMTELDTDGRPFAPGKLDTSIVPLIERGTTIQRHRGEAAPSASANVRVARAMVKEWIMAGKPPLIVRVPPDGGSDMFIRRLMIEFGKAAGDPTRVFDASGVGNQQKQAFITLLKAERSRTYETRKIDVIIGIQRTLEGTDWPICAAVYVFGLPGSSTAILQLIGRTTRKKSKTHPFANVAMARFFVETIDEETCVTLHRAQALDALGIACLLGDLESPAEWRIEKMLEDKLRSVAADTQHRLDMQAEYGTAKASDDDATLHTEAQIALMLLQRANPTLTNEQAIEQAAHLVRDGRNNNVVNNVFTGNERVLKVIHKIVHDQIAAGGGPKAKRAEQIADSIMNRALVNGFDISDLRRDIFTAVVTEFSNETLVIGSSLQQAAQHVYTLTGTTMQRYAQRIFGRIPIHESQVIDWGDQFKVQYGRYPYAHDGCNGLPEGEDWASIDRALRYGKRGLVAGSSLPKLFNYDRPDHSIAQILKWADACHQLTTRWPTSTSMRTAVPQDWGLPDPLKWGFHENWHAIDMDLRYGYRGLPGKMTLYQLLLAHGRIAPAAAVTARKAKAKAKAKPTNTKPSKHAK